MHTRRRSCARLIPRLGAQRAPYFVYENAVTAQYASIVCLATAARSAGLSRLNCLCLFLNVCVSAACIARRVPLLRALRAFILTEALALCMPLYSQDYSRGGSRRRRIPTFLSLQESLRPLPSCASTFVAVWRCPWLALPPLQSGSLAPASQPAFLHWANRGITSFCAANFGSARQTRSIALGSVPGNLFYVCVCRRYAYIRLPCLAIEQRRCF